MDKTNDTSPDDLMHHFRGRKLKSIIIFTIIVHFVVIGGTSLPYLVRSLGGPDTEKMSEDERIELAVKEATSSLRKIADSYGIRPQTLSEQLNGKRRPAAADEAGAEAGAEAAAPEPDASAEPAADPEAPKSEIEKQLEVAEPGPSLPPVEEVVDLFGE
jgi:hypothetical protein